MPKLEPMPAILIDKAEKRPYQFRAPICWRYETLETGDYSLDGFEGQVTVERKSLADLAKSMAGDERRKFRAKLLRMEDMRPGPCVVMFDATWQDIYAHNYRSEILPAAVKGTILAWSRDYPHVHWWAVGDRGPDLCYEFLRHWWHGPQRQWRHVQRALKRAAKEG